MPHVVSSGEDDAAFVICSFAGSAVWRSLFRISDLSAERHLPAGGCLCESTGHPRDAKASLPVIPSFVEFSNRPPTGRKPLPNPAAAPTRTWRLPPFFGAVRGRLAPTKRRSRMCNLPTARNQIRPVRPRLLVVEDHRDALRAMTRLFTSDGYE